jgi:hypothetical protein
MRHVFLQLIELQGDLVDLHQYDMDKKMKPCKWFSNSMMLLKGEILVLLKLQYMTLNLAIHNTAYWTKLFFGINSDFVTINGVGWFEATRGLLAWTNFGVKEKRFWLDVTGSLKFLSVEGFQGYIR